MLINWFTVIAQAINFILLVWLLERYLYRPVLRAIDERDRRIAAQLLEAAEKKAEAERERHDFQQRNAEFDQNRRELYDRASQEAKDERQRLLEEAHREYEGLRDRLQEALRNEQRDLAREVGRRTREEVFAIARRTLADLADASLEEQVAGVLIRRLNQLDGEENERTLAALSTGSGVMIRSAFELPPASKNALRQAVRQRFGNGISVEFDLRPELVGGIELATDGYKIAWSIGDYLRMLEASIAELFHKPAAGAADPSANGPTTP